MGPISLLERAPFVVDLSLMGSARLLGWPGDGGFGPSRA
jgi:hypothetical protein